MVKKKPRSIISVADGFGGLAHVPDRRFEPADDWPIRFKVPTEGDQADNWSRYLSAQCASRGWSTSQLAQIERAENSGNITVNAGPGKPQLAIVWERKLDTVRKAGGKLSVRARSIGTPEFPLSEAQEFLDQVNERCRLGLKDHAYRRGDLQYDGLPWRGELWLDDSLRLGPPSLQDDISLHGPRIVHVDIMLDFIGPSDAPWVLRFGLDEVSVFLSVIMSNFVRRADQGRAWTFVKGLEDCAVRNIGYLSPNNPLEMPVRGAERSVPLINIGRPAISEPALDVMPTEQWLPADAVELWNLYRGLRPDRRRQFLRAAAKLQEAIMYWAEHPTLSFALLVVACEALKPPEKEFRDHNHYQVVEALLGTVIREQLQRHPFPSEQVRGAHLHLGELHGSEFVELAFMSSYEDPSFREAHRALFKVSKAAIIEWLRRRGTITIPLSKQRTSRRRWFKQQAIIVPIVLAIGIVLGWLAKTLFQ